MQDLEVNIRKTKVMVNGSEELFKSKPDPFGVSGRRVTTNLMLCTKCGK